MKLMHIELNVELSYYLSLSYQFVFRRLRNNENSLRRSTAVDWDVIFVFLITFNRNSNLKSNCFITVKHMSGVIELYFYNFC